MFPELTLPRLKQLNNVMWHNPLNSKQTKHQWPQLTLQTFLQCRVWKNFSISYPVLVTTISCKYHALIWLLDCPWGKYGVVSTSRIYIQDVLKQNSGDSLLSSWIKFLLLILKKKKKPELNVRMGLVFGNSSGRVGRVFIGPTVSR